MRMRKKKHCDERMEVCSELWIKNPEDYKGKWHEAFGNDNPIEIEIGCGKGQFIVEMAKRNPDVNYLAIEKVKDVIVVAMEKASSANVDNLYFCDVDADGLENIFEKGEARGIYLNFSDPWKKNKQAKRRLTHHNFLMHYKAVFPKDGFIYFKTDNRPLFEFSLNSFAAEDGLKMQNITLDLHNSKFEGNIMTEYEERFSAMGFPIYRLEAIVMP